MSVVILLFFVFGNAAFVRPQRPHIVMIVMDDVGFADTSLYNSSNDIRTPNLELLAREGITLQRYYAPPVCSPSRASLMQGRWSWKTGLQHYCTIAPASTAAMPLELPTIAEVLGSAGYNTVAVGKWHLGYAHWRNVPVARGFQYHKGYLQGEIDYYNKTFKIPRRFLPVLNVTGYDWWEGKTVLRNESGIYNPSILDETMETIISSYDDPSKPLFMYYAHQLAHVPLDVPPSLNISSACASVPDPLRKTYCSMMRILDTSIGRVEKALRSKGMWDNALVVVVSDNGGMPNVPGGFPDSAGCNYPLRAGKGLPFEGGVRLPAVVSGGVVPQQIRGSATSTMVGVVDWFTTFMTMANASTPNRTALDGEDFWSVVVNGDSPTSDWIPLNVNLNVDFPNHGIQVGLLARNGWKLVWQNVTGPVLNYDGWYPVPPAPIQKAPVTPTSTFLFNVLDDPEERYPSSNSTQLALMEAYVENVLKPLYMKPQKNTPHPLGFPELHHGVWSPWLPLLKE